VSDRRQTTRQVAMPLTRPLLAAPALGGVRVLSGPIPRSRPDAVEHRVWLPPRRPRFRSGPPPRCAARRC
jgi:hypothetical protein